MALDAATKRLEAAERIRLEVELPVTVHQPVYTGDVRTGWTERLTYGVLEQFRPQQVDGENILLDDVQVTLAALEWTGSAWGEPFTLSRDDLLEVGGRKVVVVQPGPVEPGGVPILYEAHAGNRRETADTRRRTA